MTYLPIGSLARAALTALTLALLFAAPASAAAPGPTEARATGGSTTLKLAGLRAVPGLSVGAVAPASKSSSRLSFPITSGAINPATLRGSLAHAGSLRFRLGSKSVVLRSLRFTVTTKGSSLSGATGGKRLTLLRLSLAKAVRSSDGPLTVSARNITATLSPQGAKALNAAIGTSRFRAGLTFGTFSTKVTLGDVVLAGGATTLVPGADVTAVLSAFGVTLAATGRATTTGSGFSFPITSGKVDGKTLAGTILHSGSGVVASRGAASLALADLAVQIDATPTLSALVGPTRIDVLALDISAIQLSTTPNGLAVSNIGATLTAPGAAALNQAFGTTVFAAGLRLGTVSASGRIR